MTAKKEPQRNNQRFWTPPRVALTVVVVSLVAVAGISSCTSSDEKENRPATSSSNNSAPATRPPVKGAPAQPAFSSPVLPDNVRSAKLKTADGRTISLADYSGKVVLVNLWATWCGPCRIETPELVKLHKEFQSQGVEMVGLTNETDPRETPESVGQFVRDFQVDYHIGWATVEVLSALYDVEPQRDAIPQSFIISRDGRILKKFVGFNPVTTPPQIKQAIEDALKGA
jgi:peroxiredoxin